MPNARCAGRPGRGGTGQDQRKRPPSSAAAPGPEHFPPSAQRGVWGPEVRDPSPGRKKVPFQEGPIAAAEGDRQQPRGRRADGLPLGLAAAPAPGRDPLASCSAAASLNFLIFEQGARPFHVTLGPANYAAGPAMEASPSQGRVCGLIIIFLNCVENTHKTYHFKGCS